MLSGPVLALDLGATNLKWAVVERVGEAWRQVADGQVPTRVDLAPEEVPEAVVGQLRSELDISGSLGDQERMTIRYLVEQLEMALS